MGASHRDLLNAEDETHNTTKIAWLHTIVFSHGTQQTQGLSTAAQELLAFTSNHASICVHIQGKQLVHMREVVEDNITNTCPNLSGFNPEGGREASPQTLKLLPYNCFV